MNLIPIGISVLVLILVATLIFSRDFRHWVGQQLTGIWLLIQTYAPIVGGFLRTVLTAYGLVILTAAAVIFILLFGSLIIGWPMLTAICALWAIILLLLVWSPFGIVRAIILRLFKIKKSFLPMSVKTLVAYVALFGFLGYIHPEIMSIKFILGVALLGFISMGLRSKVKFLDAIAWPVVVGMCLLIVTNYLFPRTFRATDRWLVSVGNVHNAHRDRNTINNNTVSMVTYGKMKEDINVVYKAAFVHDTIATLKEIPVDIKQGTVVKIVNQSSDVRNYDGAGYILVQLAKKNGHFPGGEKYWIEADLVTIGTRDEIVSNQTASSSSLVSSPVTASETITLHKGEQWFPTHQFRRGDKLTLAVKYSPVKHIQGNGSTETIGVGTRDMTMCTDGSPAFEGISGLSEITVSYQ